MIVTHLFQVLGFVAMEPPTSFSPKALVDETVKVFEAMAPLRPEDVLRGQYAGYRAEPGVAPDSQTETFVALRMAIDTGAGRACRSTCARASGWPSRAAS
jgi:glucose-6-phosphate 1-dehydrogenase